jgi:hypothetical protein
MTENRLQMPEIRIPISALCHPTSVMDEKALLQRRRAFIHSEHSF